MTISTYPVNDRYIGIAYDGQHIQTHVNDVATIYNMLGQYLESVGKLPDNDSHITHLESTLATHQALSEAVEKLEAWAENQTTGQAHIWSCWLTSSDPSALLPNFSISPAWEIELIKDDDNTVVVREPTLVAAINAALIALAKEIDHVD